MGMVFGGVDQVDRFVVYAWPHVIPQINMQTFSVCGTTQLSIALEFVIDLPGYILNWTYTFTRSQKYAFWLFIQLLYGLPFPSTNSIPAFIYLPFPFTSRAIQYHQYIASLHHRH